MGYCFMHLTKMKTSSQMDAAYKHNYRLVVVPNADPYKADRNKELISLNGKSYTDAMKDSLDKMKSIGVNQSIRKNGANKQVLGMEVVLTFSREERENIDMDQWIEKNLEYLNEVFNPEGGCVEKDGYATKINNVRSAVFHGDEAGNVHIHAFIVPIDEKGRLNAKRYIGSPQKMRALQDRYAEYMEPLGLERGLKGSVADHNIIKNFYTQLNKIKVTNLPEILPDETKEEYRERAEKVFQNAQLQWYGNELKIQRSVVEEKTRLNNSIDEYKEKKKKVKSLQRHMGHLLGEEDAGPERIRQLQQAAKTQLLFEGGIEKMKEEEPDRAKLIMDLFNEAVKMQIREERKRRRKNRSEYEEFLAGEDYDEDEDIQMNYNSIHPYA